jgi:uncharacterized protein YyaL (SSP411 family)
VKIDAVLEQGHFQIEKSYEPQFGGFSQQPKFPTRPRSSTCMRHHARTGNKDRSEMAEKSLTEMARGGIYDQLGGGFARYSTDTMWIVPHFEKMLYDNALLAVAYLEAWQLTKKESYARIVRETLDYDPPRHDLEGGRLLSPPRTPTARRSRESSTSGTPAGRRRAGEGRRPLHEGVRRDPRGNWEPHEESIPKKQSVLHVVEDGDFAELKKKMFDARSKRVRPHLDDKVLTSWNALMISAMARRAGAGRARYREAAVKAARSCSTAHRKDGSCSARRGSARRSSTPTSRTTPISPRRCSTSTRRPSIAPISRKRARWSRRRSSSSGTTRGGFYTTAKGHESLIARMREEYEGPMPTGNSVMALTLLKLHDYTGDAATATAPTRRSAPTSRTSTAIRRGTPICSAGSTT